MLKKPWLRVAIGVVVVVILAVLIVPLFVNADSFRPMLESRLSNALGRKVTLGKLSFSLFSGSVVADGLTVADDPAFSSAPFLQAKSLKVGVRVGALLLHHQIDVKKFVAESPEIQLISNEKGVWNYASLGRDAPSAQQPAQSSVPAFVVGIAQIDDGKVSVSSLPAKEQPFVYDAVNITVDNLSFGHTMPFSLTAKLPGNGTVALNGAVGPLNQQDASATPVSAQLAVRKFDPVKAGVVPASAGIGMEADIDAQLKSDGKIATSTGTIVAQRLLLARGGTPAANPVNLKYKVQDDLKAQTGEVKDLAIETGPVTVHAEGTFATAPPATTVNLHVNAIKVPVDAVEARAARGWRAAAERVAAERRDADGAAGDHGNDDGSSDCRAGGGGQHAAGGVRSGIEDSGAEGADRDQRRNGDPGAARRCARDAGADGADEHQLRDSGDRDGNGAGNGGRIGRAEFSADCEAERIGRRGRCGGCRGVGAGWRCGQSAAHGSECQRAGDDYRDDFQSGDPRECGGDGEGKCHEKGVGKSAAGTGAEVGAAES